MSGPCEVWATPADMCSPCDDYALDVGLLEEALEAASGILYEMSGRRFGGVCSETVRPYSCICGGVCSCTGLSTVRLRSPVVDVTEVRVDGAVLNPARYRVDEWRDLARLPDIDGTRATWPRWQRLDLASTETDTFSVTYTYGEPPPPAGVRAAARLGCELALACNPESAGQCQLSQRVQQVTRQGVTVVLDRLDALREDLTGLPEVDIFLQAYNPARLRQRARVISPDTRSGLRRVGT